MRCTNDVRALIARQIAQVANPITDNYRKEINNESSRLEHWQKEQFKELAEQLYPVVYAWAKTMKKNYSKNIWKTASNSKDLAKQFIEWFFETNWHRTSCPSLTSEKLNELTDKKNKFTNFVEKLNAETCLDVSFVKTKEELNMLIDKAKKQVETYKN